MTAFSTTRTARGVPCLSPKSKSAHRSALDILGSQAQGRPSLRPTKTTSNAGQRAQPSTRGLCCVPSFSCQAGSVVLLIAGHMSGKSSRGRPHDPPPPVGFTEVYTYLYLVNLQGVTNRGPSQQSQPHPVQRPSMRRPGRFAFYGLPRASSTTRLRREHPMQLLGPPNRPKEMKSAHRHQRHALWHPPYNLLSPLLRRAEHSVVINNLGQGLRRGDNDSPPHA